MIENFDLGSNFFLKIFHEIFFFEGGSSRSCRDVPVRVRKRFLKNLFRPEKNLRKLEFFENVDFGSNFFCNFFRIFFFFRVDLLDLVGIYPSVKKESKNSSIQAQTSPAKIAFFWCISLKKNNVNLGRIITPRNRLGSFLKFQVIIT